MTPYAVRFIPPEELKIFKEIKRRVENLPDIDLSTDKEEILVSCHMLARIVGDYFGLKIVDGYFCSFYQHSWLLTQSGHIIDVYPVGIIGGPIMVDGMERSPMASQYKEADLKINFSSEVFTKSTEKVRQLFTKI